MPRESEKTIEKFVVKEAGRLGGKAVKGNTLNNKGFPDRIIMLPGAKIGFLELKSEGRKPTQLQAYWLKLLQDLGFKTGYADTKSKADKFIREILKC